MALLPQYAGLLQSNGLFHAALAICLLFLIRSVSKRLSSGGHLPLPPGPKGLPIIGNALDIPLKQQSAWFSETGKVCLQFELLDLGLTVFLPAIWRNTLLESSQPPLSHSEHPECLYRSSRQTWINLLRPTYSTLCERSMRI